MQSLIQTHNFKVDAVGFESQLNQYSKYLQHIVN